MAFKGRCEFYPDPQKESFPLNFQSPFASSMIPLIVERVPDALTI